MNQKCYLCGSEQNKTVFVENGIPIVRCNSCGHAFSTYQQEEHYDGYWSDEEEFDLDWWDLAHRNIYQEFIEKFLQKPEGSLLDVGCGLGFFVKMIGQEKQNWQVSGYEMSPPAVRYARETNKLNNVHQGAVQESGIPENSIDIITLWDVIEHIPYPQPLLKYLYSILKPGGFLFLQTPNFPLQLWKARLKRSIKGMREGVHYLEAKDHINNYTRKTMADLALQCKFEKPDFFAMKPILSVSGSKSELGKLSKLAFYLFTKSLWNLSLQTVNLNLTLFATMKK
ncbi:MAG: class I SAM-dependent methyltransferase [Spirochaetota bacterium]